MAEVAHSSLPHSQHQVVHRRGGRVAVVPPSYNVETTKPLIIRITVLVRAQAVQQWVRDEHTESLYRRSFVSRERRCSGFTSQHGQEVSTSTSVCGLAWTKVEPIPLSTGVWNVVVALISLESVCSAQRFEIIAKNATRLIK